LVLLSASRESSVGKFDFVNKLMKKKKKYSVVDMNQFFPMNARGRPP
jgi:hypothetical protein